MELTRDQTMQKNSELEDMGIETIQTEKLEIKGLKKMSRAYESYATV